MRDYNKHDIKSDKLRLKGSIMLINTITRYCYTVSIPILSGSKFKGQGYQTQLITCVKFFEVITTIN